jgi:hypothetical protein
MRWGLSWGDRFPHVIDIGGVRYDVRTEKVGRGNWNAFGTVNGICVQATGSSERAARYKWTETVRKMFPLLQSPNEEAASGAAGVFPETCEVLRSVERRLTTRPRLDT